MACILDEMLVELGTLMDAPNRSDKAKKDIRSIMEGVVVAKRSMTEISFNIATLKKDDPAVKLRKGWTGPVEYRGRKFNSIEHAYQYAKAHVLRNEEAKKEILNKFSSKKAKEIGDNLQGSIEQQTEWEDTQRAILEDITKQAFMQNEELMDTLQGTGDKVLTNRNSYTNDNLYARILMSVRDGHIPIEMPKTESKEKKEATKRFISTAEFLRTYILDTKESRHSLSTEAMRVFKGKYLELMDMKSMHKGVLEKIAYGGNIASYNKRTNTLNNKKAEAAIEAARYTMETMDEGFPDAQGVFDVEYHVRTFQEKAEEDANKLLGC